MISYAPSILMILLMVAILFGFRFVLLDSSGKAHTLRRCNPMREKLPFNLSLCRCLIEELRLSLDSLSQETHVTISNELLLLLLALFRHSVVIGLDPF